MMRIHFLTLFPKMCQAVAGEGMLKRAVDQGVLSWEWVNIRDYASDAHRTVDDAPYGGGPGMVMKIEPIDRALTDGQVRWGGLGKVVMPSPRGRRFDHAVARQLAQESRLTFICGHYEGIDERVAMKWQAEEYSIGDFVTTGGELPALLMVDAIVRLIPGVLGNALSVEEESFAQGTLEYPQYTRPAEFAGWKVPEILLSGHHAAIREWRRRESLRTTWERRPDLMFKGGTAS